MQHVNTSKYLVPLRFSELSKSEERHVNNRHVLQRYHSKTHFGRTNLHRRGRMHVTAEDFLTDLEADRRGHRMLRDLV